MNHKTLLLFLLLFHFSSNAQIEVTGNWNPTNNMELQYNFEKDELKIMERTTYVNLSVKTYRFTRSKNKLFLKRNERFLSNDKFPLDTLSILERNDSILKMYRYSTNENLTLLRTNAPRPKKKLPKELVPKNEVRKYVRLYRNIDIHFNDNGKESVVYKRFGKYYNPSVGCLETPRFDRSKSDIDYGLINMVLHYQDQEYNWRPQRISNDILYGQILNRKIDVKLIPNRTAESKSTDHLIGTWIILKDKAKFDAAANKKSKTVYVGHSQLKILANNEIEYNDQINTQNGKVKLETFHGIDFLWSGGNCLCDNTDAMLVNVMCNFNFQGKLEIIDDRRFVLNPIFCPDISANGMKGMTTEPLYFVRID